MKRYILLILSLVLLITNVKTNGQAIITKNHSIPLGQDTVIALIPAEYRGNLYWQQSLDFNNWITYNTFENDTLNIKLDAEAYYRAKIIDGTCNPIYSDTIKVILDSFESVYTIPTIELAYPDSIGMIVKFVINNDTLVCEEINNEYIFQGDIILSREQLKLDSLKGASVSFFELWPDNTVYYQIDDALEEDSRVANAIKHWDVKTPLKFIERTNQKNYISFISSSTGTNSSLGMIGGGQKINIASNAITGNVIHEIGHAVGLIHEHTRANRKDYIDIKWFNIKLNMWHNFFKIDQINEISLYDDFDFNSIMLYPCFSDKSVAIDPTKPIISKWDNSYYNSNMRALSQGDIRIVKYLYPPIKPEVSTLNAINISTNLAELVGIVSDDGGEPILERGFYWSSTNENPGANDNKELVSGQVGAFIKTLINLQPNTTYFYRAFATNKIGTSTGDVQSFTTNQDLSAPTVSTNAATNITETSATLNGNVTSDGNATITQRGFYWSSTDQTPDSNDNKETVSGTTGSYSKTITGLQANTTYYYRAFATNSQGTAYGALDTICTSATSNSTGTVTDIDGNVYQTVTIGTQVWMAENLKTTKYNDGAAIPNVTDNTVWKVLNSGAYCWYDNNANIYKNIYGAMYNWYAINTRKLCPAGWHIPPPEEWTTLVNYLGGYSVAGGKLKEIGISHWLDPNTGATNVSGFTGLPGGIRIDGTFFYVGKLSYWWKTTSDPQIDWPWGLQNNFEDMLNIFMSKTSGLYVRCVKD